MFPPSDLVFLVVLELLALLVDQAEVEVQDALADVDDGQDSVLVEVLAAVDPADGGNLAGVADQAAVALVGSAEDQDTGAGVRSVVRGPANVAEVRKVTHRVGGPVESS